MFPTRRAVIAGALAASSFARPAVARDWPTRSIRFVVTLAAGGLNDILARAYGEYISNELGQPVVVENKPGASGGVAATEVMRAPPDGYTILFASTTTLLGNPALFKDLPYDPAALSLISYMPTGPLPLFVRTDTGVTDIASLVAFAKSKGANMGTYGIGTYAHLVFGELNARLGIDMQPVHYRGEAPMYVGLLGGAVHGAIGSWITALPGLETGATRAIATPRRFSKLPGVATFADQGVASTVFDITGFISASGPPGMPADLVERYSRLFVAAGKTPKIAEIVSRFGLEEAAFDHVAFKQLAAKEGPLWKEYVTKLGIRL